MLIKRLKYASHTNKMDTEARFYSKSKYLNPPLKIRQYSGLFATGVVGSSVLKEVVGKPALFWLVFIGIAIISVYQINWN